MANEEQLAILKQGAAVWNVWRTENPQSEIDLDGADLSDADLTKVNLTDAYLRRTDLEGADLADANLRGASLSGATLRFVDLKFKDLSTTNFNWADLTGANLGLTNLHKGDLIWANLVDANLRAADLRGASLIGANLTGADLSKANLSGANLSTANIVSGKIDKANFDGCRIYGISAWDLQGIPASQSGLIVTPSRVSNVTVDDIEIGQFVYLLLNNKKIRDVIDTISKKGVLILGRFTEERKTVLDAIRKKLRELDFVPMMFDFEKPSQRDFTETIKTLAGLCRFIIADITNPKSSPLELQATMPDYMIPFVPIIQEDEEPFAMFQDLNQKYGKWVLDLLEYDSTENLISVLKEAVVMPAIELADKLLDKKAEAIRKRHVKDFN